MDMTSVQEPELRPLDMFAADMEDGIASAIGQIYAIWADAEGILGDRDTATVALASYAMQAEDIAGIAGNHGADGLHDVCRYMAKQLEDMGQRGEGLSLSSHAFLAEWPELLLGHMTNPGDPVAAELLVKHLQNPHWSSPMRDDEARDLTQRVNFGKGYDVGSPPGIESESITDNCLEAATDRHVPEVTAITQQPDAGPMIGEPSADETDTTAAPFAGDADNTNDRGEAGDAVMDEISALFTLAESEGLLGLQEVCMRVMQNAGLFDEEQIRSGTPVHTMLESFAPLADEYMTSGGDPGTADRLIEYLGADCWPEPLAAGERESLRLILQADREAPDVAAPIASAEVSPVAEVPSEQPVDDADFDPPVEGQEQVVNQELIDMLAGELTGIKDDLAQLLPKTEFSDESADESMGAVAEYADLLERLGVASEAVGFSALKSYLSALHARIGSSGGLGFSARQREVLSLLPGSIQAYLAAPGDASTSEGLLDLLRGDIWEPPPATAYAVSLLRALSMVTVSKEALGVEARQTEALPENVSLAIPGDLSQELLDGLLQELPIQTGDFSTAIQHIANGSGTLKDVDAAKRAAHTLKGAANTVGIKGIANLTHHVEDILVALSKYQTLPGRRMAAMLTNAGDCLEAMSEAVMGTGPEPDYALTVLQEVLDWANRIDREGVPDDDLPVELGMQDTKPLAASPKAGADAETSPSAQAGEAMVRVPASLVDELLRLVGETIISTGQVRERLQRLLRQNKAIVAQNKVFLNLSTELEEMVDLRGAAAGFGAVREDDEFDPLEFEHYSELHTVSRRLIEAATDCGELSAEVEGELGNLGEVVDVQNRLHEATQNAMMRTRMVPVSSVVSRLQRSVRQTSRLLDKAVSLNVVGAETMIDSNILNDLVDPMMHMLRNAVDHGVETSEQRVAAGKSREGRIDLKFSTEGNQVVVRCRDDGAGLNLAAVRGIAESKGLLASDQVMSDDELARLILAPGFSTRAESTQVSGRGVGMDVVYSRVLQLKGSLNLKRDPGKGLEIELRLPAMLISTHALLVRARARLFAISSYGIQDIRYVTLDQIQKVGEESFFRIGEELMPLLDLDTLLNLRSERRGDDRKGGFPALLVRDDAGSVQAVRVQEIIDSRSLVVKNLGRYVPKPHGVVGATILGDGSVAAVIDIPELMRKPARLASVQVMDEARGGQSGLTSARQILRTAMVVDDSLSARRATAQFMKDSGFEVRSAIDGLEAVAILDKWKPSIMLVDMEMPRMNGLELTAHVRARQDTAKIPVIMITSRSTEKHRYQAQAAGVNVYLTKPFGDDELLRHVTELTAA